MSRGGDPGLPPTTAAALRAYAERAAPELLEAACADAHAEVRRRLRDALVPMLLEQVAGSDPTRAAADLSAEPSAEPPAEPSTEPPAEPTAESTAEPAADPTEAGWYVFGVVREPHTAPQLPADVELVSHQGLTAMVQRVPLADFSQDIAAVEGPDDLAWLERYARQHDHVLNAALETAAVLPLRFGTVLGARDDVRTLLQRHGDAFAAWLDELADHAEYTVKAWVDETALDEHDDTGGSDPAATGTAYLQQRQAQRLRDEERRRSLATLVDEVHERLAAVVEAATTVPGRSDAPAPRPAHHGAYLVAASGGDALVAEIDALVSEHAHHGLQLDLAGPWPAHHFLPASWEDDAANGTPASSSA